LRAPRLHVVILHAVGCGVVCGEITAHTEEHCMLNPPRCARRGSIQTGADDVLTVRRTELAVRLESKRPRAALAARGRS